MHNKQKMTLRRKRMIILLIMMGFTISYSILWLSGFFESHRFFNWSDSISNIDFDQTVLHESSPRILYAPTFLTSEECDEIISLAEKDLERSMVAATQNEGGGHSVDSARTSSGAWIGRYSSHPAVQTFTRRVSAWSKIPASHGEDVQVLRYDIGQQYKPHLDYFDPDHYGDEFLKNGGQRVVSVLCYLNDVPEGGETTFPYIHLDVKPVKGSAVLWFNADMTGTLDRTSLHAGKPVIKGVAFQSK